MSRQVLKRLRSLCEEKTSTHIDCDCVWCKDIPALISEAERPWAQQAEAEKLNEHLRHLLDVERGNLATALLDLEGMEGTCERQRAKLKEVEAERDHHEQETARLRKQINEALLVGEEDRDLCIHMIRQTIQRDTCKEEAPDEEPMLSEAKASATLADDPEMPQSKRTDVEELKHKSLLERAAKIIKSFQERFIVGPSLRGEISGFLQDLEIEKSVDCQTCGDSGWLWEEAGVQNFWFFGARLIPCPDCKPEEVLPAVCLVCGARCETTGPCPKCGVIPGSYRGKIP